MGENTMLQGMGWLPDYPGFKDFTPVSGRVLREGTVVHLIARLPLDPNDNFRIDCYPVPSNGHEGGAGYPGTLLTGSGVSRFRLTYRR